MIEEFIAEEFKYQNKSLSNNTPDNNFFSEADDSRNIDAKQCREIVILQAKVDEQGQEIVILRGKVDDQSRQIDKQSSQIDKQSHQIDKLLHSASQIQKIIRRKLVFVARDLLIEKAKTEINFMGVDVFGLTRSDKEAIGNL